MATLGSRIRSLRKAAKLSIATLEKEIKINNIQKYETDSVRPGADAILALADYFLVSTDWLLKGKEPVPTEATSINDPELQRAYDTLKILYQDSNPNLRGWAIITFENAFEEYIEIEEHQTLKRKKDA